MAPFLRALRSFWLTVAKEFVFWFSLVPGVFLAVLDEPLHTLGLLYLATILFPLVSISFWKAYRAVRMTPKEEEVTST